MSAKPEPIIIHGKSEIDQMAAAAHKMSKEKGFWDGDYNFGEKIALIISEAVEALEAERDGEGLFYVTKEGKPEGVLVELADVIIRVFDLWKFLSSASIQNIITSKMYYNSTRSKKHGKRF